MFNRRGRLKECPGHSWVSHVSRSGVRLWYCERCGRHVRHPEKLKLLNLLASQINYCHRGNRFTKFSQDALDRIHLNLVKKSSGGVPRC